MSHKANFWLASLAPDRVKSGAFRVLFHLCDHHNGDTTPELACFPSQETLRDKTGLSNGALNNALNEMEKGGLLRRRRSTIPGTSERRTYYILGCDFDHPTTLTPELGVSPNSSPLEAALEQTPVSEVANSILGPSKLQPTGEEPVRTKIDDDDKRDEPTIRELILAECGADPISGLTGPNGGVIGTRADMQAVDRWRADLGLDDGSILAVIRDVMARKRDGPPARFSYFDRPMQDEAGRRLQPKLEPTHVQSPQPHRRLSNADASNLAIAVAGATRRPSDPDWL